MPKRSQRAKPGEGRRARPASPACAYSTTNVGEKSAGASERRGLNESRLGLLDDVDQRPGVRVFELAFQEPRGHLDAHPPLQGRKVGRRREDLVALDASIDRVGEVVREHLYLARKAARSEQADRRAGGDRAAHDVVHIGAFLQRLLDQDQLDFAAGIAPLPHDDVHRAAGERLGESLLDKMGPLRFPRGPGNHATLTVGVPAGWRLAR